jgi:acyl-CoA synthetase (AMP-forming)/AMP-acid ligase II
MTLPLVPGVARFQRVDDVPRVQAGERPDALALVQGQQRWSYRRWNDAIDLVAARLGAAGLRAGDRLMIVGENGLVVATMIHAALRCNAWPVILNARLSAREVDTIAGHSGARFAVFATDVSPDAAKHAERLAASKTEWPPLPVFALSPRREATPEIMTGDPARDVAALIYTSGTTGTPKGVMLSHGNLLHVAKYSGHLRGLSPTDRVFGALPMSHVFGLSSVFIGTTLYGGALFLVSRFDPGAALDMLAEERLTVFQGVPAMFARLLEHLATSGRKIDAPALRYASSGGSPLDLSLKHETEAVFGVPLHNGFGMTELSPTVAQTRIDAPRTDDSCGPIVDGIEVRIAGGDGRALPAGETGVLKVRGPTVMQGYYRAPELTASVVDAEGFLDTGDLARLDAEGNLFIVGRAKDLIIRSGFNVHPEEVEAVLRGHPAVTLAAVVGRAAGGGNEEVIAFVQLIPGTGASEAELQAWCGPRLAPYKRPARIVALAALPASSTGKVQKAPLRVRAANLGREGAA